MLFLLFSSFRQFSSFRHGLFAGAFTRWCLCAMLLLLAHFFFSCHVRKKHGRHDFSILLFPLPLPHSSSQVRHFPIAMAFFPFFFQGKKNLAHSSRAFILILISPSISHNLPRAFISRIALEQQNAQRRIVHGLRRFLFFFFSQFHPLWKVSCIALD